MAYRKLHEHYTPDMFSPAGILRLAEQELTTLPQQCRCFIGFVLLNL